MRFIFPTLYAVLIARGTAISKPIVAGQQPARNVARRGMLVIPARSHLIVLIVRVVTVLTTRIVQNGWRKSKFKR